MSARYVLVGSGIAALSAAEALRERDPGARLTLVSEEAGPFYSRPGLAYLLTREAPEHQLFVRSPREVEALELERVEGRAERIDRDAHALQLADGRRIPYDRLLLATGAASIPPPFPGGDLAGVHGLDGLADARRLLRGVRRRGTAVVVGGGSTALELVEGLHARGMRVHYLLRGERYWARVLDATESGIVAERLAAAGVRLHANTEVARVVGSSGRARAVETRDGRTLPCDLVAVAIGVRPRLRLAREAGLATDRGVRVDPRLCTSDPDVLAAGDLAQVVDPATGQADLDTLWPSALAQGRVAGENLAGGAAVYRPAVPLNVTRLAGVVTTIVGRVGGGEDPDLLTLTRGQSERWRARPGAWTAAAGRGADRIRLLVDERRLVGAVVMGDQRLSQTIVQMVRDETDVSHLRAELAASPGEAIPRLVALAESRPSSSHAPGGWR